MLEMIAAVSNWASAIFTLAAALIGLFFWYSDKPWVKRSIAVLALAAALFLILGIIADHFFKVREAQERITPPGRRKKRLSFKSSPKTRYHLSVYGRL